MSAFHFQSCEEGVGPAVRTPARFLNLRFPAYGCFTVAAVQRGNPFHSRLSARVNSGWPLTSVLPSGTIVVYG